MVIKIKNFENELNRLDSLVLEGIGLFDDKTFTRVSGDNIAKLEEIEFVLLDNIEEMTNFQEEFFQLRASYNYGKGFGTIVHNLLAELGNSTLEKNFNNLIKILNQHLNEVRAKPLNDYIFYIPTRLEVQLSENELSKLKKFSRKAFGINILNKLPKSISHSLKSSSLNLLFQSRSILLELNCTARDIQFALDNNINKDIDAFIGIIAYANHFRRTSRRWSSSIIPDDSISDLPMEAPNLFVIFLKNRSTLVYPDIKDAPFIQNLDIQIKEHKVVTPIGKEFWNIHNKPNGNYNFILSFIKILGGQTESLRDLSKELFRLYVNAITDKQLELSFLKFWILSEKILKCAGPINDDKILQILKKLMRKSSERRIKIIYKKRNDMVHEFKIDRITQEDRNLSKILSDHLMTIYFDPKAKFKNFEEFRFLLENLFLDEDKVKSRMKILKKL
jgi:hypothetical protein